VILKGSVIFVFKCGGFSHEGNAKGFWDLMSKIDEEQF
jgi:hypothetical protein